MKKTLLLKLYILLIIALMVVGNVYSQVGINTTSPQAGSMLDVDSPDKGILIPRVDIADVNTIAPITGGATESLLVYNTNSTTGIGYYYWTGALWVPLAGDDWTTAGNAGTSVASFIGTVDAQPVRFRTDNTQRFEMTTNGRLRANANGTDSNPLFSWVGDTNLGFYRAGADQLGFVSNGIERFRIPNADQVHALSGGSNALPFYSYEADTDTGIWSSSDDRLNLTSGGLEFVELFENGGTNALYINDSGADMNVRIESSNDANAFFIDGANDNVGLGTNTPDNSAQLELTNNDRGILINRVALTSTAVAAPVTSPANGLFVYNTANASSGDTEVLPGFYYWDGGQWVAMGGTGGRDWSLEGNAGTSPGINFLGTTDDVDLQIRTNDTNRMYVDNTGTIGIGNTPYNNAALRVNNNPMDFGIIAEANTVGGAAIYSEDTGDGLGLFSTSSNNHGIYGTTAYTGSAFLIGGIIGWGTGTDGANGMLAVANQQANGSRSNMGIRAVSGSTTSISSSQVLNVGVNSNATDLGLYVMTEGPITNGPDIEAARFQTNYTGSPINADARDPRAQLAGYTTNSQAGGGTMYYGAYMYSGGSSSNSSYAYGGARFNGTNYKIIGNGSVSTIVDGAGRDSSKKVMFAPEAPEVLFEDYGTGRLVNGTANITIDPIFANNIVVNNDHPLKVFIQLEGDCNGVYVTNKTSNGFTVKELQKGKSNVEFSWHIVANRKDEGGRSGEGSNFSALRFPDAPAPFQPDTKVSESIEENNVKPKLSVQQE